MLYYNQMLSNLKGRCQGKGAAEARGGAGAGAEEPLSVPDSCRPDPAKLGNDADALTILTMCEAALLSSC